VKFGLLNSKDQNYRKLTESTILHVAVFVYHLREPIGSLGFSGWPRTRRGRDGRLKIGEGGGRYKKVDHLLGSLPEVHLGKVGCG